MKDYLKLLFVAVLGGAIVLGGQHISKQESSPVRQVAEFKQDLTPVPSFRGTSCSSAETGGLPDLKKAADMTVHSVVYIQTEFTTKSSVYDDYFSIDDFFGRRSPSVLRASGSGVIISSNGYVVTNNHVVQEADKITVTLNDKRSYNARMIGADPTTDLALLKIEEDNLSFVTFGSSDDIQVGDWVLAVGNPFNLTSTVTAGIISAKARNINILGSNSAIESFLQTDAVVNPGNSGGALVDTKGKLVGINAAIASNTGSFVGYSFAIPVSIVKKVVTDLKEFGAVQRAYMGITIKEVNARLAQEMKLDTIRGVLVESTMDNGAAAKSGIKANDIILSINGTNVSSPSELLEKLGLQRPGDKVKVRILRNDAEKYFEVVLTNKYGTTDLDKQSNTEIYSRLGAELEVPSKGTKQSLGISYGVQVVNLEDGLFKAAGIRKGFIILKISSIKIYSENDVRKALNSKSGGILIEGIYPNGVRAYYGVGL